MSSISPRIARLQELLQMEERRSSIQEELEQLNSRMMSLRDGLFDDQAPVSSSSARPQVSRGRKPGRTPRGELKSQIIAALKSAGSNGVRVSDLARSLGIKATNAFAWFQTATKRYPQIKKMNRGQYRLDGDIPGADAAPKSTAARATKAAKGGRGGKRKTGRGELKQSIMDLLNAAGSKGISVKD